jgi:membrane protein
MASVPEPIERAYGFVREVYEGYARANGPQFAAAIAYHALFAMAPLTLVAVAVAGWVLGDAAAVGSVSRALETALGPNGAAIAEDLLLQASQPTSGLLAGIVGGLFAIVGGARAFVQLQAGLNKVWGVTPAPGTVWWRVALARLIPFGMVGLGGLGLLAAAVSRSLLRTGVELGILPDWLVEQGIAFTALLLLGVLLFLAFVFRVLPDVQVEWRFVWFGAALVTTAVSLASWGLQTYIARSGVDSVFGAAGSLVAVMLWAYVTAQVVLMGAEVTEAVARRAGAPIRPASYAVRVRRELEVEEQVGEGATGDETP